MRFSEKVLIKMEERLERLSFSGLKSSQLIHAIKTFITPMVDYIMRYSIVSINKLNKLDIKIRSKVNKQLKGKALPRDFFYTRPQDSGLGFTRLEERYEVNKVINNSHLLNSEIRTRVMEDMD
jgi:hypothetical protein